MTTKYLKCKRCDKFYAENHDTILTITWTPDLGDSIELCDECFEDFKRFIKEKAIERSKS